MRNFYISHSTSRQRGGQHCFTQNSRLSLAHITVTPLPFCKRTMHALGACSRVIFAKNWRRIGLESSMMSSLQTIWKDRKLFTTNNSYLLDSTPSSPTLCIRSSNHVLVYLVLLSDESYSLCKCPVYMPASDVGHRHTVPCSGTGT